MKHKVLRKLDSLKTTMLERLKQQFEELNEPESSLFFQTAEQEIISKWQTYRFGILDNQNLKISNFLLEARAIIIGTVPLVLGDYHST